MKNSTRLVRQPRIFLIIALLGMGVGFPPGLPVALTDESIRFEGAPVDSDGDGVNDLRELFDGTNPNDPNSFDPLSIGLIAHYPLDGNSQDKSGYGNHAVNFNAESAADRLGRPDSAYQFNGVSSYLEAPDQPYLRAFPITISCWFRDSSSGSGFKGLVGKYQAAFWNGYQLSVDQNGLLWPWYLLFRGNDVIGDYDVDGVSNPSFTSQNVRDGRWHHVAFTVDDRGGTLYIDGFLVATKAWRGVPGIVTSSLPLTIGNYVGEQGGYFSGEIDEVRIYNRALEPKEVFRLCRRVPKEFSLDFSDLAGTYIGNFGEADLDEPTEALLRNGQVLITLKSNRQFTGALVFNGRKAGFRGRFDADGNWSGTATVAGRLVEMEMFMEAGELGNRMSCLVVIDGEESTAFVLLPVAHTGAKGDVFGWSGARLNVLFESAGSSGKTFGHGYAGATCTKDGVMRFAGRLADNTAWSGAARVVRDETGGLSLPLAVPLNSTKGLLHGEGTLDPAVDVQSGDAEFYSVGAWTWVRGANARARAHKTGFVEGLQPFGQRWNYQRGKNLWTGAVNQLPVRMSWDAGLAVLPEARAFSTMWPLNNRLVWSPAPPRGFQLTVSAARGEFSGKIPTGSAVLPFRGLLLSPGVASDGGQILGGGFIAGQESSGELELLDVPQ